MQHNLSEETEAFLAIRLLFPSNVTWKKMLCTFKENFKDFASESADVSDGCVFFLSTLINDGWFFILQS